MTGYEVKKKPPLQTIADEEVVSGVSDNLTPQAYDESIPKNLQQ